MYSKLSHLKEAVFVRTDKIHPIIILSIKDSFEIERHKEVESERMEKKCHTNNNQKRTEVVILM